MHLFAYYGIKKFGYKKFEHKKFGHKKFSQAIAWWQATLGFVALIIALIAFLPKPFEFQIRNYNDATHMTYIFLTPNASDGFAGNQNKFMGSAQKETLNVYYHEKDNPNETKLFVCIGERAWWWGKLTIIKNFSPVFETQTTQLKLLQQFCKPITQAEADKRGLSI